MNSVGDVMSEMIHVYRTAKSSKMPWSDAVCAARILKEVRLMIEGSAFEDRLAEIEQKLGIANPRSNGHAVGDARTQVRPL